MKHPFDGLQLDLSEIVEDPRPLIKQRFRVSERTFELREVTDEPELLTTLRPTIKRSLDLRDNSTSWDIPLIDAITDAVLKLAYPLKRT